MDGDGYVAILGKWLEIDTYCLMIVVYAPQDHNKKDILWRELTNIINLSNTLSIVLGDFNEVRTGSERKGSNFDARGALKFNEFISNSGLCDLPLGGKRFTRMDNIGSKLSKLDRILVSKDYIDRWPNSYVLALPREFSDHSPLLLSNSFADYGPIPFKFYNTWLSDKEFGTLVDSSWASAVGHQRDSLAVRFKTKLQFLKSKIKQWRTMAKHQQSVATVTLRNRLDCLYNKAEITPLTSSEAVERINIVKNLTAC